MKQSRKSKRRTSENPKLEMTPMIDVVFQLLIFFIVTLKQEDILAHLDVSRPQAAASTQTKMDETLQILVYNPRKYGGEGVAVQGKQISFQRLDKHLKRLAGISKDLSIVIKCDGDSYHESLIKVLNLCSKEGLTNISVFSL